MSEQWLIPEKLCSFDEKVRIELGPQIIEMDCTDENLCDTVTQRGYKIGARDAVGRFIRPNEMPEDSEDSIKHKKRVSASISQEKSLGVYGVVNKGEKMAVVDWKAKHVPHLWKIYQMQETDELNKEGDPISRFILVGEAADLDDAFSQGRKLAGEMS